MGPLVFIPQSRNALAYVTLFQHATLTRGGDEDAIDIAGGAMRLSRGLQ